MTPQYQNSYILNEVQFQCSMSVKRVKASYLNAYYPSFVRGSVALQLIQALQ